ncbi:unnamed protein product [Scytosiphon promiscuus]
MNSTPLPRSAPPGPRQRLRGGSLPAGCGGCTMGRLARAGWVRTTACATLLLLILVELYHIVVEPNAAEIHTIFDTGLPVITKDATCADWVAWIPRRIEPAVVLQVVSEEYIPMQQNFIRLMERNSSFNRHNLYLMCIDEASRSFFDKQMGIRCVPVGALHVSGPHDIWKLRVRVLSCLIQIGRVDVIVSDADALWLNDPTQELLYGRRSGSDGVAGDGGRRSDYDAGEGAMGDIRGGDVVASRGNFPEDLQEAWGTTMCMGFIFFRAKNIEGMTTFLRVVEHLVMENGNDQRSINQAAAQLGIVWDGDMRYEPSTGYGLGEIPAARIIAAADGRDDRNPDGGARRALADRQGQVLPLTVSLLPHSTYTRVCEHAPFSAERTMVAHCLHPATEGRAEVKTFWMQKMDLWSVEDDP